MKYVSPDQAERIRGRLTRLYGEKEAPLLMSRFLMMLGRYGVGLGPRQPRRLWDARDVVVIAYADAVSQEGERPLQTLRGFLNERLRGLVSTIHLLPFYPWSSDDGFSVIDYRQVDSRYGTWNDIAALGRDYDLMFDLVLNHCSRESGWFRAFVTGVDPALDYFIKVDPAVDLSAVVRPRSSPLLTRTATRDGEAWVWTTFSADQVDLNWRSPDVLFEFLDILFLYLSQGARMLRLDAVAFLWKEVGTSCMSLPQTHEVVKLWRDVVELVAPGTLLITETNVPHAENISYFGAGDEAHLVYNFTLPPLVLHAYHRQDTRLLQEWARRLPVLPAGQAFFNFMASHDGIGVRPLQGLVPPEEIAWLAERITERGGRVSMRAVGEERQPYELNCTYRSALEVPGDPEGSRRRFIASQALMLGFRGVPALYLHSLLGTRNWEEGVEKTGQNRAINRRKFSRQELDEALNEEAGGQGEILARLTAILRRRASHAAFHPDSPMELLKLDEGLFGYVRHDPEGRDRVACLFNFTEEARRLRLGEVHPMFEEEAPWRDLLSTSIHKAGGGRCFTLDPWEGVWLVRREEGAKR